MSINDIISVNFYEIVYVCNKNCEKQKFENKNCGSFYIFLIYFNFYFLFLYFHFCQLHFKNKILSRIANIYDGYWHKLTKKLFKK